MSKSALVAVIDSLQNATKALQWEPPKPSGRTTIRTTRIPTPASTQAPDRGKFLEQSRTRKRLGPGRQHRPLQRRRPRAGPRSSSPSDVDPACVDILYRERVKKDGEDILPLVIDLTNPSPALGWAHSERDSLADRGPADMVIGPRAGASPRHRQQRADADGGRVLQAASVAR